MNEPYLNPEPMKATLERVQAKYRMLEKRAEHEAVRKKIRIEYPPEQTPNRGNSPE